MKKLFLSICLLIPSFSHADSVTSGNVGLLIISTGVGGGRSWGDKLNSNMQIIASTLSTAVSAISGIQTSTNNLAVNIYNSTNNIPSTLLASTPTWTGSHVFTSSMTFSSPTVNIGGNEYIFQSTAPESGNNVLQRNGKRLIWGGDGGGSAVGGGGTSQNSTVTLTMFHSGGQVFIATSPLVAIDGLAGTPVMTSTFHAFAFRAYTMSPSTVAVTKFQLRWSTSNAGAFPFNNWGPQIHSSTGSAYGVKISTVLNFNPAASYALHIDSIPTSGIPPSTYGIQADGWYDPQ